MKIKFPNYNTKMQGRFFVVLWLISLSQLAEAATTAEKIASAEAVIAKQQALIAEQQAILAVTPASKTATIEKNNNLIAKEELAIENQNIVITALNTPSVTATITGIQNITKYNLSLTQVTLLNATCSPACTPKTILAPNAVQAYSFTSTSGSLVLDYDVLNNSVNIGHLTIKILPGSVTLVNGVGGVITQGVQNSQINYVPPVPYWTSQFTDVTNWTSNNWDVSSSLPSWGFANIAIIASSSTEQSPKGDNFMRLQYPAGSADYQSAPPVGGAQFYGAMINTNAPVTLSYYVLFPTSFPFVASTRGATLGKLPGLYGGIGNTGSNVPNGTDGWSTRYMWCDYSTPTKQKFVGGGELLQFTVGSNLGTYGTVNGTFLGCGNWSFVADGKWHNLQQTIHLNDVGSANGRIDVCFDGMPVLTQQNITFRNVSTLQTNGILFQTFFGGSGSSYATPISTHADFADFALYYYPPTTPAGMCMTNP